MALELYMLGLVVQDMKKSLEFYRQLGLVIPEGSETKTHVQIKMESGLTLFLDSNPGRWDPHFVRREPPTGRDASNIQTILEFYLKTQDEVEAKYAELVNCGYQSHAAPYATSTGMCFAMVHDPDGYTILLSGEVSK